MRLPKPAAGDELADDRTDRCKSDRNPQPRENVRNCRWNLQLGDHLPLRRPMQREHLAQQRIRLLETGQRVRENREQRHDERRGSYRGLTKAEPDHQQRRDRDDRHGLKEHAERQNRATQDRHGEEADRQRYAESEARGQPPNDRTEGGERRGSRSRATVRAWLHRHRWAPAADRMQPIRFAQSSPTRRVTRTGRSTPAGDRAALRSCASNSVKRRANALTCSLNAGVNFSD